MAKKLVFYLEDDEMMASTARYSLGNKLVQELIELHIFSEISALDYALKDMTPLLLVLNNSLKYLKNEPKVTGSSLVSKYKSTFPHLVIALCSVFLPEKDRIEAKKNGCDFIFSPVGDFRISLTRIINRIEEASLVNTTE